MKRLDRDVNYGDPSDGTAAKDISRRAFVQALSAGGIGMLGMGAFIQSCKEKKVLPSSELARAYVEELLKVIRLVHERELPAIQNAAAHAVQAKEQSHQIYAWMTGGMLDGEMSATRPGSPQLFLTNDIHKAVRYDFVITNDPYAVKEFGDRLIKIIGITRPSLLNNETPPKALENMGTVRIEDTADFVLYSHVPPNDGILEVKGVNFPLGPASGIVQTFLFFALTAEIAEGLLQKSIPFPIS
jgi:hypothetical protein